MALSMKSTPMQFLSKNSDRFRNMSVMPLCSLRTHKSIFLLNALILSLASNYVEKHF